jgi:hypothetical protein
MGHRPLSDVCDLTVERLLLEEGNPMSLVFQNIDPPPTPLSARRVCPSQQSRGVHTRRAERGGGRSILWKTRDIGLPSYSDNLSTDFTHDSRWNTFD